MSRPETVVLSTDAVIHLLEKAARRTVVGCGPVLAALAHKNDSASLAEARGSVFDLAEALDKLDRMRGLVPREE